MTSHDIRKKLNLTQLQLSNLFSIPLSTVKNWDARDCMPVYIYNLLDWIYEHENGEEYTISEFLDYQKKYHSELYSSKK